MVSFLHIYFDLYDTQNGSTNHNHLLKGIFGQRENRYRELLPKLFWKGKITKKTQICNKSIQFS